jgi:short-subunit dehydrogenase
MEVNYFGAVGLTKAVLTDMIEQQSGHVVVVTSLTGKFSSPGRGAYAASKHALHGFFDTLRMEHTRDNIFVTMICPGFVRTNVTKNSLQGDGVPQGRMDKTTAKGLDPSEAAAKILKAVKKKKQEVYFGGKEVLGVYIKRFFPAMLNRVVLSSKENWELGKTVEK